MEQLILVQQADIRPMLVDETLALTTTAA